MSDCNHEWEPEFDAAADAAAYNDGLNYRPATEICLNCRKRQKIKYEDELEWYEVLFWFPIIMIPLIIFVAISPILFLIYGIYSELSPFVTKTYHRYRDLFLEIIN